MKFYINIIHFFTSVTEINTINIKKRKKALLNFAYEIILFYIHLKFVQADF